MKKRYIMALVLCMFFIIPQVTKACWVYLSVDDMVEQSDVILIGEIVNREGGSIKTEVVNYNKWKVNVHYYLKGESTDSQIIVATPDNTTSLHYDLNANGNQVLLFLSKESDYYSPLSPQAVVGVEFEKGEELMESLQVSNENIDPAYKEDLEKLLSTVEPIKVLEPEVEVSEAEVSDDAQQDDVLKLGGFILVGASTMMFIVMKNKK